MLNIELNELPLWPLTHKKIDLQALCLLLQELENILEMSIFVVRKCFAEKFLNS